MRGDGSAAELEASITNTSLAPLVHTTSRQFTSLWSLKLLLKTARLATYRRLTTLFASIATMAPVTFWREPLQYFHWAARRKPAIFWSMVLGSIGPVMMVRIKTCCML